MKTQKTARPAKKHLVQTSQEQKNSWDTQNGLNKVEGILTSAIQLKELRDGDAYYWAFFQLEGIQAEIPVIFRLKDNSLPEVPHKAKILLKGTWSESENSSRPSFTCQEYQILSPPFQPTTKDLKEQISQLLTTSLKKLGEWKQRTDYLFRKKKDLEEIDKLTKLGTEYLSAYLFLRRAFYSNYQDNLLPHNQFNQEEYLTKISQEVEEIACQVRAYQAKNVFDK